VEGGQIWSINLKATVYDALRMMADKIGSLPSCSDGDNLAGLLSERDYARKIILKGRSSKDTTVDEQDLPSDHDRPISSADGYASTTEPCPSFARDQPQWVNLGDRLHSEIWSIGLSQRTRTIEKLQSYTRGTLKPRRHRSSRPRLMHSPIAGSGGSPG